MDLNFIDSLGPEFNEVKELAKRVKNYPDDAKIWGDLVHCIEAFDGGLSRNSSPEALQAWRDIYNVLLNKYPLFYGYWSRWATYEFNISGPEAAEYVFERGIAAIGNSVDLRHAYCKFKMETCHDVDAVRELFEQSAAAVGSDFQAAPFWDLYLEYEDRMGAYDNILAILERIIHIPMAKHDVYWNKFRELAWVRPLENLQPAEELARVRSAIENDASATGQFMTSHEIDHRMRIHFIDNMYLGIHNSTEIEIKKRSPFEERIQRLYFNIEELSHADVETWNKYLDFEEAEGDYNRIVALYDRCLVACALYDKLWFRYARWMADQPGKTEELRNIFRRASIFTPTGRPYIRMHWARWEESLINEATRLASASVCTYSPGSHPLALPQLQQSADSFELPPRHEGNRLSVAKDIYREILVELPNYMEGIIALAHFERRHNGLDAALGVILKYIDESGTNIYTKGGLLSEYAKMIWETEGNADKARQLFERVEKQYRDNRKFWTDWMLFETSIPTTPATIDEQLKRLRILVKKIREEANLPLDLIRDLTDKFLCYIEAHGGANAMEEYMLLDKDSKGPFTVQHTLKKKLAYDGNEQTTDRRRYLEAGHPGLEVNDTEIARGIDPYEHYYKEQGESSRPAGHRDPVRIRGHP